jgi:hypothetical protein
MSLKIISKNKIYDGKRFINKIIVAYLISILAIGTVLPTVHSDPTGSWWNTQWNYRKLLTMDTTKISGMLVNFPILVQLTDSDLASHVQSTGNDICFVLYSDNTTKLNHEIEYYNSGTLYAWVNITRLSSTTNTKIWMYYGNAGSGNQQNKYGTWNSKYKAVYHLDENGPPYVDSTSNKNNITSADVNGSGMAQSGGIYKWQHFNGSSNRFVLPSSVSFSGAYTLEAIANTDSVASSEVLMGYGLTISSPSPGVVMGISAVSNAIFVGNSNSQKALSPTSTYVTTKTSHWWSDVYGSNTSLLFYLDGTNYTSSLSNVNHFSNADGYYTIGARYSNGYGMCWKGCIDEVRISSGTWNASWIKTCYDNQKDPASFCSRGGQEQVPSGGNQPPVFGTPTPANVSANNPISLTWSIPINDAEGDLFSWIIQCSNRQFQGGNGAVNGTKTISLSGLAYSTMYKVWVNATDPTGSGLYTRRWYTFTTRGSSNNPPVFGAPSPANGSTGNLLSLCWSSSINDPEGNAFSWTIQCSNGQVNSSIGALNGTKSLILSGLAYSTSYKVWVNATDPAGSGLYTRRWFTFTTKGNNPPMFGTPSPTNGSTGNLLSLSWSIPISDFDGDSFNWVIQCSNGQSANANGASNGTKSLSLSGLTNLTTYKVWVNATDPYGSGLYTRKWYTFTTQQQNLPPNKPNQPSGNNSGKIKKMYTYTTSTTDPNGDQVYYLWDWGDGNNSEWLGPYNSGVTISTTHNWTVKGSYSIKVKAKDIYGKESVWSDPLPIKMPYSFNKLILQFFEWVFQRFPHAFPLLRHLMEY